MSREPDTVEVWLVPTDQPASVLDRLRGHLDADELRRAAGQPDPVRRARFVAAHGAMRAIVAGRVGAAPAALRWTRGPHGKPELADLPAAPRVSFSTCQGLALVALCRRRSVGVDIERLPADRDAIRLAARYFPAAQAAFVAAADGAGAAADRFTTLWSRKEACVKVRGGRLVEALPLTVQGPAPLAVHDGAGPRDPVYLVHDLPAPHRHRAAVALAGPEPGRVCWRVWSPCAEPASVAAQSTKNPNSPRNAKRDFHA